MKPATSALLNQGRFAIRALWNQAMSGFGRGAGKRFMTNGCALLGSMCAPINCRVHCLAIRVSRSMRAAGQRTGLASLGSELLAGRRSWSDKRRRLRPTIVITTSCMRPSAAIWNSPICDEHRCASPRHLYCWYRRTTWRLFMRQPKLGNNDTISFVMPRVLCRSAPCQR